MVEMVFQIPECAAFMPVAGLLGVVSCEYIEMTPRPQSLELHPHDFLIGV